MTELECKYDFADGHIKGITCLEDKVDVLFELWNETLIHISFFDYKAIKDFGSIDCMIDCVQCRDDSPFKKELLEYVLRLDGCEDEIADTKSYTFLSSWENEAVLEILASHTSITDISA